MRRLGGLALIALGVSSVLLGCAVAIVFGPDDTVGTGPHRLSSIGPAIVTAPEALAYSGPQVELTVTTPGRDRELFVGVGHDVDVRDFLAETPRTRIDTITIPWEISTSEVRGSGSPKGGPDAVDWWIADARQPGRLVLSWRLPDVAADVMILALDGPRRLVVDLTAALVVPGIFVVGLALTVIGMGTSVFGWAVRSTQAASPGSHAHRPLETPAEPPRGGGSGRFQRPAGEP
ncbi:MAG: hypothetical protein ACRDOY_05870 [Nocardioidaceae bacterium]